MTKKSAYILLIIYSSLLLAIPFAITGAVYKAKYYRQHLQDGCDKLETTCQSKMINNTECNIYVNGTLFCQRDVKIERCQNRTYICYPKGVDIDNCQISESCINSDNHLSLIFTNVNIVIFCIIFIIYFYLAMVLAHSIYKKRNSKKEMALLEDYE